jgi:recombination associated protein RdgC
MWFKQLGIYRFSSPIDYNPEAFADKLRARLFSPCQALTPVSSGWVPPIGDEDAELVYGANGYLLFCFSIQEKILPATVIREQVQEKVEEIQERDDRKVGRNEKISIKEEVIFTLLPKAFTRTKRVYAYVDTKAHLLIIDAASPATLDLVTSSLRECFGSLPLEPWFSAELSGRLTQLVKGEMPQDPFVINDACVLQNARLTGNTVRCQQQDLSTPAVLEFLRQGHQVQELAMTWQERFSFVLTAGGLIKRCRFHEVVKEMATDIHAEDETQRHVADFVIMSDLVHQMSQALSEFFSGPAMAAQNTQSPAGEVSASPA